MGMASVPPATQVSEFDSAFMAVATDANVANGRKLTLTGALSLGGAQVTKHLYVAGAGDQQTLLDLDFLEIVGSANAAIRLFQATPNTGGRYLSLYGAGAVLAHRIDAKLGATSILGAQGGKVNFGFDGSLHASARVGFTFTDGGVLLPVLTTAERDAINSGSLTPGIALYNSTTGEANVRGASAWLSMIANPLGGITTGYKIARGETALDGGNPTPITTGLTTITGVAVTLKKATAPGVGTCLVTYDTTGGTLNLYGWKPTGAGDCTLIASTGTETVGWVAIGT